jgi:hypothetical protein
MKTNDIRVIKLMKEGFAFETLRNLNESQINILYKRMIKEQETGTVTTKDPKKAEEMAKNGVNVRLEKEISEDDQLDQDIQNVTYGDTGQEEKQQGPGEYGNNPENDEKMDNNDVDGMSTESEIKEKAVSKKQQKFMGLVKAYKEGDVEPYDVSKKVKKAAKSMTKKEVDDFASTEHEGLPTKVENTKKESYIRNVKMIEESLIKLVQKHITPSMTKKDLLNLVEQSPGTKEAPTKAPTKTPSKPGKRRWNQPKHKPAPKAKKDDETFAMQLPSFLKFDNLDITFSDEKKS